MFTKGYDCRCPGCGNCDAAAARKSGKLISEEEFLDKLSSVPKVVFEKAKQKLLQSKGGWYFTDGELAVEAYKIFKS